MTYFNARRVVGKVCAVLLVFTAACDDEPTRVDTGNATLGQAYVVGNAPLIDASDAIDVPAVQVDASVRDSLPWDNNDVALIEAVRDGGGYVAISFKEPESAHLRDTGIRSNVSAARVKGAVKAVQGKGGGGDQFSQASGIDLWPIATGISPPGERLTFRGFRRTTKTVPRRWISHE